MSLARVAVPVLVLIACAGNVAAQGQIAINGTPGGDMIRLGRDAAGNYWSINNGVVVMHGPGFTEAIVVGLGGADLISARGFGPAPLPLDIPLIATGDAGQDRIEGGDAADRIDGGTEDDVLMGFDGDDSIWGRTGRDSIEGMAGEDKLYGNEENDVIGGGEERDFIEGGFLKDFIFGDSGNDVIFGDVRLVAGGSGDKIWGMSGFDDVYGGFGGDYISGGDDSDSLLGEQGDDTIHGNDEPDDVLGNDGNDKVYGNGAVDSLVRGGAGDDLCVGGGGSPDPVDGGAGTDTCAECPAPDACTNCEVLRLAMAELAVRDPLHAAWDPAQQRLDLEADFVDTFTDSRDYTQDLDGPNRCPDPVLGTDLVIGDALLIGQDVQGHYLFTDVPVQILTTQGAPLLTATLTDVRIDPVRVRFDAQVTNVVITNSVGSRFLDLMQAAVLGGQPVESWVMNSSSVGELLASTASFTQAGQAQGDFEVLFPHTGSLGGRVPESCTNAVDDNADGCSDCDDFDCAGHPACIEAICSDLVDNDADGTIDCDDEDCAASPFCRELTCANGIDDDNDFWQDCFDDDCSKAPNCREDCANGFDDNGDGRTDCHDPVCEGFDPSCREEVNCDDGLDNDHDGFIDCDTSDCRFGPGPGEVTNVRASRFGGPGGVMLAWTPTMIGGSPASMRYDVLRSSSAANFLTGTTCIEANDGPNVSAVDLVAPVAGQVFNYLVRAETSCGIGSLGTGAGGAPVVARTCQLHADGAPCDDSAFCTVGEAWTADACAGGASRSCDDALPHTFDYCNEVVDACIHQ